MEALMESSNPSPKTADQTELEIRYALLSDELDQALKTISDHEHRITKLEKSLLDLVDWLRDSGVSAVGDERDETPPPHY
jgi:uncharacterized coiled-coil protein SlyX